MAVRCVTLQPSQASSHANSMAPVTSTTWLLPLPPAKDKS